VNSRVSVQTLSVDAVRRSLTSHPTRPGFRVLDPAEAISHPTEYVRQLIRADREKETKRRLEFALLERVDDEEYSDVTPADVEDLRSRVRAGRKGC
jgi:hypothetical protein